MTKARFFSSIYLAKQNILDIYYTHKHRHDDCIDFAVSPHFSHCTLSPFPINNLKKEFFTFHRRRFLYFEMFVKYQKQNRLNLGKTNYAAKEKQFGGNKAGIFKMTDHFKKQKTKHHIILHITFVSAKRLKKSFLDTLAKNTSTARRNHIISHIY